MGEVYLKQYANVVTVLSEYSDKTAKVCTFTKFGQNVGLCKTGFGSGQHLTKVIFKIKMHDFAALISVLSKIKNQTSGDHFYIVGCGKNYKGNNTQLVLQSWPEKPNVLELSSYTSADLPQTVIEVPGPEDEEGNWIDIDETQPHQEWNKDFGSFYFSSKDNLPDMVKKMRDHYREVQNLDDINEPDLEDEDDKEKGPHQVFIPSDEETAPAKKRLLTPPPITVTPNPPPKKRSSATVKARAPKKQKTDEVRETLAALFEFMRVNNFESPKECVLQYNLQLNKYEKHNYLDVIKDYSESDLLAAFANVKKMYNYLDVIKDYSETDLLAAFTSVKKMLK